MPKSVSILRRKAKPIRLIAMDVDGVLTGGEIILLKSGEEIKFWNAKDRLIMAVLRHSSTRLHFAWITGRASQTVLDTAKDLGVHEVIQKTQNKKKVLQSVLKKYMLKPNQVAFIGDDLIDLSAMALSGFSACPHDAVSDVRKRADYVSSVDGGRGVVRDVIEFILKAQNKWDSLVKPFLS